MTSRNATGSAPRIGLAAARAFLSGRYGAVTGLEALRAGEWSSAFAFRADGRDLVLRLSRYGEDFAKDRLAARHASAALPIPRVVDVGAALGVHFAVSERARGAYLESLDAPALRRTLPALFAALDAMREADLSATTGYGGWGADGNAEQPTWRDVLLAVGADRPASRTHGWRVALERAPGAAGAFDAGLAAMRALVDRCPDERHLVHSDLLYYNVLVSDDRITAVLDWGSSIYGDFLHDVAWLAFWSGWYPAWRGIDLAAEARRHYASIGLAVPGFDERLRCYQLHIGLDGLAYAAWRGRRHEVDRRAKRVLTLARGERP